MGEPNICEGSPVSLSSDGNESVFAMEEAANKRGRSSSEEAPGRVPDESAKKKSKTFEDLTGKVTGLIRKFSNKASIEDDDEIDELLIDNSNVKPGPPERTESKEQESSKISAIVEIHHVPKAKGNKMVVEEKENEMEGINLDNEENESEDEGNDDDSGEEADGSGESEEERDRKGDGEREQGGDRQEEGQGDNRQGRDLGEHQGREQEVGDGENEEGG